jgi:hypothetical protein
MASQLTLILWTDHPADASLASDLAQEATRQIFRSTSQGAAVVSATAVTMEAHDIAAAVEAFAPEIDEGETPTPDVQSAPVVTEPQPTNADGTPLAELAAKVETPPTV